MTKRRKGKRVLRVPALLAGLNREAFLKFGLLVMNLYLTERKNINEKGRLWTIEKIANWRKPSLVMFGASGL